MLSVTFDPVGSWFLVAVLAAATTGLTVWAYQKRLRGTTGAWRWFALGLRLAAILMCLIAALRPTVVFQLKAQQASSLIFLSDDSASMKFPDEVGGQTRWAFARKTLAEARDAAKQLGEKLNVKFYRYDATLRDDPAEKPEGKPDDPTGLATDLGGALTESYKNEGNTRVAGIFVLGDGQNNKGVSPLVAARQLKTSQVPVYTVAFGAETAGERLKDVGIREFLAGPVGFVKNQLQIKADLLVRGYANQPLDVDLFVEGQPDAVAHQRIKVPEGADQVSIAGLKYIPQTPGEKKLTLKVTPQPGEMIATNNVMSTFVDVMKGGINVLMIQGPRSLWEHKFVMSSIASSPDIQGEDRILRVPARLGAGELKDDDLKPGKYDAYILCDLPADFLTADQQARLAQAVDKGAGLIMLGGRSSFGAGKWGRTELARVLPVQMGNDDGLLAPREGIRFVPNTRGVESFLFQIAPTREESLRLWNELPPLTGINHLGKPKENAVIFGSSGGDRPEPIMVASDGVGRVLAFGGETWTWARMLGGQGAAAHRRFWRQVIFWLVHKEDKGESEVKLALNSRRIGVGQKLEFDVAARDAKGAVVPGVKFEARLESSEQVDGKPKTTVPLDLFSRGEESHGVFIATETPPGDYRIAVVASKDGREIGRDDARFIVYLDERELEKPAADRALLRQIAELTEGEFIPPEQIGKSLLALKGKLFTDAYTQSERRVWDNWPFLLAFAAVLTLEWWIRKRHGWV